MFLPMHQILHMYSYFDSNFDPRAEQVNCIRWIYHFIYAYKYTKPYSYNTLTFMYNVGGICG